MSLTLENTKGGDFQPHPAGVHDSVCIDVMDCGMMQTTFQGVTKMVHRLKLVFESEAVTDKGVRCTIQKVVTASLAPKATLSKMLSMWRGRPIGEGEKIDLDDLIGASCVLVVGHTKSADGSKTYANIDAISKPTRKVIPSGAYDPVAARQRFADWKAKNGLPPMPTPKPATARDNGEGSDLGPQAAAPVAAAPARPAAPPPYRPLPVNAAGPVTPPVAAPVPAAAPAPAPVAAPAAVALPAEAGDVDVPF